MRLLQQADMPACVAATLCAHILLTRLFFPTLRLLQGMAMDAMLQPIPLLFLDRFQTAGMITIKGTNVFHGRSWRCHMHWWWRYT